MDANLISPFIEAVMHVLPQLGIQDIKRGNLALKEKLAATKNVTTIIGLSKKLRGNVAYAMSEETAKQIASAMMMGMPVDELNEMAESAIAELANMVTSNAATIFEGQGLQVDISPPTLITGENVTAMISQVKTLVVEVLTPHGVVEVNVGLEM